ncbi:MAG: hypothetical protein JSS96_09090 [Bacteroidetes bacterium]|nr:hypothetical protein [Bacteroidota bacterium]
MFSLFNLGLVCHITGIAMMVGGVLANFVAMAQLWKFLPAEKSKAQVIAKAIARFPIVQGLGGFLIISGGIMMMIFFHGLPMHQAWFKVKLILLLLLILNAIVTAWPANVLLKQLLNGENNIPNEQSKVIKVKQRITLYHVLQLMFFVLIFIVSVTRFD